MTVRRWSEWLNRLRMRRSRWGVVAAIAAVGLVLWWAFQPVEVDVETATVRRQDFEQVLEDDGRTRVRQRLIITMPWAGELERPPWKEGSVVSAGEALFWVRPGRPSLQDARTRAEWDARGAAAQAAWQRAARQSEVALVAWQRASLAVARAVDLAEQEFISRAQLEMAVLDVQREERSWSAAQAAERAALHELEWTRVMGAEWTSATGAWRRSVTAPTDVRVLRVLQPHATALPLGAAVMEVADVRQPEVIVPLLSADALKVAPGLPVRLNPWGPGVQPTGSSGWIEGRVRLVEPAAVTKVSALGLEEQRVVVVIDPSNPLPEGDGYAVRVQLVLQRQAQARVVPAGAVFPMPGQPDRQAVFSVRDGRAEQREVTVRARSGGWAWIDDTPDHATLEDGQTIVVYPPAALREGARVRVVQR